MPGDIPDMKHLPPGAIKHELKFKKGDRLPDGSISDRDQTFFTIDIPDKEVNLARKETSPGFDKQGNSKSRRQIEARDVWWRTPQNPATSDYHRKQPRTPYSKERLIGAEVHQHYRPRVRRKPSRGKDA